MFFGFESRPDVLPTDIKIQRTAKRVCTPGKKCKGSMYTTFKNGYAEETTEEVFHYWDGTEDFGVVSYKCIAEYKGHTYGWYEDDF